MHSCGLTDCLDAMVEASGWKQRKQNKGSEGSNRGLGVACYNYHTGSKSNRISSGAFVQVHPDGTAALLIGQPELGQGANTVMSQIVAEELGLRLDDVRIAAQIDTDVSPADPGATGSMGTDTTGNAVRAAADDARRQLLEVAAGILAVGTDDLELRHGAVHVKSDPERSIPLGVLVRDAANRDGKLILGRGTYTPEWEAIDRQTGLMQEVPPYGSGAIAAEVEVDTTTGQVRVIKATVVHDIGFALNPALVEGQIEGQIHQGVGQALYENHLSEPGRVLTASLADYRMPRTCEMPKVAIKLLEIPDPRGPYGGKECSEGPVGGVAPAIVNAVFDAIGVRINDLPITPEKVLNALKDKRAS